MKHRSVAVVVVFSCLMLLGTAAWGQAITASLQGRVLDPSGAVVRKAAVTVTSSDTGFSRSTTSSDSGEYKISSLPAGNYKLTTKAAGFQPQTRTLPLSVGDTATVDITLAPGQVEQQVMVTTEAPLIEPTRTSTDSVIEQEKIKSLREWARGRARFAGREAAIVDLFRKAE